MSLQQSVQSQQNIINHYLILKLHLWFIKHLNIYKTSWIIEHMSPYFLIPNIIIFLIKSICKQLHTFIKCKQPEMCNRFIISFYLQSNDTLSASACFCYIYRRNDNRLPKKTFTRLYEILISCIYIKYFSILYLIVDCSTIKVNLILNKTGWLFAYA